jgi:hypothetical protein
MHAAMSAIAAALADDSLGRPVQGRVRQREPATLDDIMMSGLLLLRRGEAR